ncbi:MAG: hypothetical protein JO323_25980 [Acidobacteriia bacterium]|nr:hypothetical protein [Terriglobia bacterium]
MKRDVLLWLAILTGPVIWMVSFGANFALAPWACSLQWKPALYVVSASALLLTAGSGVLAWFEWQRIGREFPGETDGVVPRSRALASGGVIVNATFALVIVSQFIVEVILGACD